MQTEKQKAARQLNWEVFRLKGALAGILESKLVSSVDKAIIGSLVKNTIINVQVKKSAAKHFNREYKLGDDVCVSGRLHEKDDNKIRTIDSLNWEYISLSKEDIKKAESALSNLALACHNSKVLYTQKLIRIKRPTHKKQISIIPAFITNFLNKRKIKAIKSANNFLKTGSK